MNLYDIVAPLTIEEAKIDYQKKCVRDKKKMELGENAWNDGSNSWTSDQDQWAKESAETVVALTGVDEDGLVGPDSTSPVGGHVDEARLQVGDPVVVTAPNAYEGKTGEISEFSPSGKFVIVNLYNHGEHSMHLSDVEYNQYADDEDADEYGSYEDDMAEGIFDRFKTPKQDPKAEALRKELMLKDRETVPDMDDYSWQIGWHYGDGNKDVKAAYSDAYYDNPTIPSPPEPRSFKLGFDARKKQGVAEWVNPAVAMNAKPLTKPTPDEQKKIDRDVKLLGKYHEKGLSLGGAAKRFNKFKAKHQNEEQGVEEGDLEEQQLDEAPARDVLLGLLDKFYADMKMPPRQGSHTGELGIKPPGTRVWTRGDGTRHRDPGYITANYFADDKKLAEKLATKFWPWLLKQSGVKSIGQVSGEFGSSPMKDAVAYKGLYFSGGHYGVEFGSLGRIKNPKSVWRHKPFELEPKGEQGVAEASTIDGQVQDPKSLVWKQTNMPYEAAVKQFGSKNVRVKRGGLRNGQDFIEVLCPLGEQAVAEAKATGQRVKVIKGDYSGKTGTIDEVLTNPFRHYGKMYKINLDDGTSVTLSNDALRLVKTVAEAGLGMWGGGEPDDWDSMSAEEQKASLKQSSERQAAKNKEETEKGRVDFINLNKDEPGFEGGLYGPYDQGIFDFVSGRDFAGGSDEYERGWRVARKYSKQQDLDEVKQRLDAKCWKGKHKEGTKIKGGVRVNNCVPNESVEEGWRHNPTGGELNTLIMDYADAVRDAFEYGDYGHDDESQEASDRASEILGTIRAKFGDEAVEHARKAGDANTFGREGNTHGHGEPDRLTGGLRHGKSQDITKAGKIPKNTQNAMKNTAKNYGRSRINGPQGVLPESENDDYAGSTPSNGKIAARNAYKLGKTYTNPYSTRFNKGEYALWDKSYNNEMSRLKKKPQSVAESYWTRLQNEKNTRLNSLVNELSESVKNIK